VLTILKNTKVNGKVDIPYMKWKLRNVPNHQPAYKKPRKSGFQRRPTSPKRMGGLHAFSRMQDMIVSIPTQITAAQLSSQNVSLATEQHPKVAQSQVIPSVPYIIGIFHTLL
jgi:hypothetical protein